MTLFCSLLFDFQKSTFHGRNNLKIDTQFLIEKQTGQLKSCAEENFHRGCSIHLSGKQGLLINGGNYLLLILSTHSCFLFAPRQTPASPIWLLFQRCNRYVKVKTPERVVSLLKFFKRCLTFPIP